MKKIISRAIYRFFNIVIIIIDCLIHKNKNLIVFQLGKDDLFNGNLLAFFNYITSVKKGEYLLGVSYYKRKPEIDKRVDFIFKTNSFTGILILLKCSVLLIQHARNDHFIHGIKGSRRVIVNLWHGIPIKGLRYSSVSGYHKQNKNFKKEVCEYSGIISSSKIDRLAMGASFHMDFNRIWLTGLPRNDIFFTDKNIADLTHMCDLDKIQRIKKNKKLLLYAPTFRDNNGNTFNGIYNFADDELSKLNNLLMNYNSLFGLRGHEYFSNKNEMFLNYKNIIDLSGDVIADVQSLLLGTDLLISDYSSIWIDFLPMKKPMVAFTYDFDSYLTDRGLLYNMNEIFPGDIVYDFSTLYSILEEYLSGKRDFKTENHTKSMDFFYEFRDDKSSERVFEKITEILDKRG